VDRPTIKRTLPYEVGSGCLRAWPPTGTRITSHTEGCTWQEISQGTRVRSRALSGSRSDIWKSAMQTVETLTAIAMKCETCRQILERSLHQVQNHEFRASLYIQRASLNRRAGEIRGAGRPMQRFAYFGHTCVRSKCAPLSRGPFPLAYSVSKGTTTAMCFATGAATPRSLFFFQSGGYPETSWKTPGTP